MTPSISFKLWGFGWDESSGDYKVFAYALNDGQSRCEIYSLKCDAWKKVDGSCMSIGHSRRRGLLLGKGKLHWVSCDYVNGNLGRIDYFDLEGGVFEIVEAPLLSEVSRRWGYLGKIQECLVVYHWHAHDNHATNDWVGDVWVMKEYGAKKSWMKLMVFDGSLPPIWTSPSMDSFRIGRERGFLMMDSRNLIVYDLKGHDLILPGVSVVCVESLASPLGCIERRLSV